MDRDGDASFLIGVMLGLFIGAGVALVLSPASGEENRAQLSGAMQGAKQSLESKAGEAKGRVEGAAEGVAK